MLTAHMPNFWMVRAGEGGHLAGDFKDRSLVAIGWPAAGDLTQVSSLDEMRKRVAAAYPDLSPGAVINGAGVLHKFRNSISLGDHILSYDPERRMYLLGRAAGDYQFSPQLFEEYPNVRGVEWQAEVGRDDLSTSTKNTLGSTLTLFEPGAAVLRELQNAIGGKPVVVVKPQAEDLQEEASEVIFRDTLSRAHEFIKDRILAISPEEMESLTAALLRAMGYKTRVTPKGPDQGRDVVASPDGLGFQAPRIIVEVKHRPKESMGAEKIRGFIGGLRSGDRGLYVSTGGFTKEARYEAGRSNVPVTLVDSDYLANLVVEHYEGFDAEGRSLVPLKKVYWPIP
jgi:restriction system protein